MEIKGSNTIDIPESATALSQKLSLLPRITSYPWATEKLLSDCRKSLCKNEIG